MNNYCVEEGKLTSEILKGSWTDASTFESLPRANNLVASADANKMDSRDVAIRERSRRMCRGETVRDSELRQIDAGREIWRSSIPLMGDTRSCAGTFATTPPLNRQRAGALRSCILRPSPDPNLDSRMPTSGCDRLIGLPNASIPTNPPSSDHNEAANRNSLEAELLQTERCYYQSDDIEEYER